MIEFSNDSVFNRSWLYASFIIVVLVASLFDVASELVAGENLIEMIDDIIMFLFGAIILSLLCIDYFKQQRSLRDLKTQLESMRGKLELSDRHIGNQYRSVVQKQFTTWQLTPAEQEIAVTLMKGLSFREVAEIRQIREKTARQHAANVYKKAGLSGRHELAGWFFEDLFSPEPTDA